MSYIKKYIKFLIVLTIIIFLLLIIFFLFDGNNLNQKNIFKFSSILIFIFTCMNYLLIKRIFTYDKYNNYNNYNNLGVYNNYDNNYNKYEKLGGGKELFKIEIEDTNNMNNLDKLDMSANSNNLNKSANSNNLSNLDKSDKSVMSNNLENNENIENKQNKPNAYVWLLMKGDAYLPGIMVSMYSVLRTKTKNDLVVMTTPDVSEEAKNTIKKIGKIVEVDYIEFKIADIYSEKQKQTYSSWMDVAFTKWNCLKLTEYNKVLLIDADAIVLDNVDHLFNLETPAAPFNTSYLEKKNIRQTNRKLENNGFLLNPHEGKFGLDNYLAHGETVTPNTMHKILYYDNNSNKKTMSLVASTILLSPSNEDFELFMDMMKHMQPFGFKRCSSAVDEQSISYFYSCYKKQNWTNIHHRYNLMGWKKDFLHETDFPYVIHYVSDKPWKLKYNKWEDIICWYKIAAEMLENEKSLNVNEKSLNVNEKSLNVNEKSLNVNEIKLDKKNIDGVKNAEDIFIKKLLNNKNNINKNNNINSCLDILDKLNIDK